MQLSFWGAAGEVTGSCHLFEVAATRFLVDCGLFQGTREVAERNRAPWPFDPAAIDFVVLTHAHIDHSGLLPRLARDGFRGAVHATPATAELVAVMLRDSAHLQSQDAERAARRRRPGRPVLPPLYSAADVDALLGRLAPLPYDVERELAPGVRARLRDAGHILGSASVELWLADGPRRVKVVVSGDLGQPGRPILRDPTPIADADVLLVESTYGNREHKPLAPTLDEFVDAVERTLRTKRGNVLVPAFAVGRTQELLYWFARLSAEGRLGELDVFVDSPMATEVTAITARHAELWDPETRALVERGRRGEAPGLRVRHTRTVSESMALNRVAGGAVIVAASGMCDGGRIRHHLRHHLPSPRTTVVIVGYQAVGTLGRRLVDGAQRVTIAGEDVPVRAELVTLGGFSAHADRRALLDWLRAFRAPPRRTFLVHGEAEVARAFAGAIRDELGWRAEVPTHGMRVALD